MKVIEKQPHIVATKTYKYFICDRCNCEFYADEKDVVYVPSNFLFPSTYESNCPVCSRRLEYTGYHTVETLYEGEEAVRSFLEENGNILNHRKDNSHV